MYPKLNGNQYYDKNVYETDSSGNEIYAQLKNGSEIYLQINGLDIMAKRINSKREKVPYFALDKFKHPICPLLKRNMMYLELNIPYPQNTQSKELYPKLNNKEYYIGTNSICRYAINQHFEEYYATNQNKMYYAFKINENQDFIEFPRINKQNEPTFIWEEDNLLYPFNLNTLKPLYPRDSALNEFYLKKNGKDCFAIRDNKPFYAKDNKRHDILPNDANYIPYYIFYMLNEKKYEVYPRRDNKDYYKDVNYFEMYAKKDKDEYYAKRENNDDYFALKTGFPFYASNGNKVEIYPSTHNGNNFYLKLQKQEKIAINKRNKKGYYAKNFAEEEFYPKSFEDEKIKNIPQVQVKKNYEFIEPSLTDIIAHEATSN